jgi:hypothetical protein
MDIFKFDFSLSGFRFVFDKTMKYLMLRLDVGMKGHGIELGSIPNQPWY